MSTHDRQIWPGMLAHLKRHAAPICRQWFEEIEPVGVSGGVLRLRAHSNIHRDYLQRACAEPFNDAARSVSQMLLTVQFLGPDDQVASAGGAPQVVVETRSTSTSAVRTREGVAAPSARGRSSRNASATPRSGGGAGVSASAPWPEAGTVDSDDLIAEIRGEGTSEEAPVAAAAPAARANPSPTPAPVVSVAPLRRSSLSLALNPDYTFDNFVIGPTNRLAHAAALAVAEKPGRTYNPFFVHGSVGLGKTHLLQAVCLRILETSPGTRIYYTSCEGFITQFMEAVQAGEMSAFRHTFRDVDVLAIDDVHFLAKRDRTQEEFFHTFNSLYQAQKQIILSSDAPPEDIPDLEERLVSRFKWGLVSHVGPPCYETRIAILRNKAKMRGFEIDDEVAGFVAARIDSNIRELEGAIVKLQVMAQVERRPIDMDMAVSALGADAVGRGDKQVQIQAIIDAVTAYYGVKLTDLQSKRRHRSVAIPRQVCMFLCRRHTRYSLEEIGGYFGGRDHTTVMHAVKTIETRVDADGDFAQVIRRLDEQVRMPVVS